MGIGRKQIRTISVIALKGRFFGDTETDELEHAIEAEAAAGNTRLVLDFTQCDALNSTAIGVLMRWFAHYKNRGGEIKLCCLGKRLKDLFVMTRLIMVFDHHDTEQQALAAFAAGEP